MILSTADTDLEQRVLVQLIRAGIEDTFIAYYKIHRNVLPAVIQYQPLQD